MLDLKIHSTTGNGTPATSHVKNTLLPVRFVTLTGGKVISGARKKTNQLIEEEKTTFFHFYLNHMVYV